MVRIRKVIFITYSTMVTRTNEVWTNAEWTNVVVTAVITNFVEVDFEVFEVFT